MAIIKNFKTIISRRIIAFCFVVTCTFSSIAEEKSKELFFVLGQEGGWIPYHQGVENGRSGIFGDITDALFEYTGIKFSPVYFPPKRAEKALNDGLVDFDFVCLEWLKKADFGDQFVVSEPFLEITEYLVTLKKNENLVPNKEAMYGKPVGTIAGYFYYDDDRFTRVDFLNEKLLVLGLKSERFDAIILEKETANYWANVSKVDISFPALHSKGKLLMRLRSEHKALMPDIDEALKKIKSSGRLQKILESHQVSPRIL